MGRVRSVAILGGGPSGAALGRFLAQAGLDVVLFHQGKRPPIIVGESLVPASRSLHPTARHRGRGGRLQHLEGRRDLRLRPGEHASASASTKSARRRRPTPTTCRATASTRACWRRRAAPGFASWIIHGHVERDGDSVTACGSPTRRSPPPASSARRTSSSTPAGRRRLLARLMDVPTVDGERRDTALHAHFEGIEVEIPGNVHTDRLEHGWLWRIPLPGRVSWAPWSTRTRCASSVTRPRSSSTTC